MKLYARLLGLGQGYKKIEWLLPYVQGRLVLDVGCAGGGKEAHLKDNWLHGHLVTTSQECVGLDHNKETTLFLRENGYKVFTADAQNFNLKRCFDVVVAGDLLEHLEDLKGFFTSVRRVLKNNGYLLITTPNPWFLSRFLRCWFKGDGGVNPDHVHWFCPGSIRELLRRYGFEIEKLEFGSSEPIFYYFFFLPPVLRHTSIFVAALKIPQKHDSYRKNSKLLMC